MRYVSLAGADRNLNERACALKEARALQTRAFEALGVGFAGAAAGCKQGRMGASALGGKAWKFYLFAAFRARTSSSTSSANSSATGAP